MHQAVTTHSKPARFDEIAFYDSVTEALRAAKGVVRCAGGYASQIDEDPLSDALGVARDKLDEVSALLATWDDYRAAKAREAQERCNAAKIALGVGDPPPALTAETRRHLRKLLAVSDPKRRKTRRRAS